MNKAGGPACKKTPHLPAAGSLYRLCCIGKEFSSSIRGYTFLCCKTLDLLFCLFFILFWLLPQLYTNFSRRSLPFFPKFLTAFHSTSNLFTQANYLWPMPYIQVLPKGGSQWQTLREEDYFRMPTFGYRSRLFEALYLGVDDPQKSADIQKEIALWVAQRYHTLYGLAPKAVRFVAGLHRAAPGKKFTGHWQMPPFNTFAAENVYEISRHDLSEKGSYETK